jgi:PQQ-like domain
VAVSNGVYNPYPLIGGISTTGGAWSALDVKTGNILWQTADPSGAIDPGAVSVANGVLFATSFSGNRHALDASTGKILWTFANGGSVIDGLSIVDGVILGIGLQENQTGHAKQQSIRIHAGRLLGKCDKDLERARYEKMRLGSVPEVLMKFDGRIIFAAALIGIAASGQACALRISHSETKLD